MNKLIIGTMLAVGLCCANEQHTWESAQEFNESILKRISREQAIKLVLKSKLGIRKTKIKSDINNFFV